MFSQGPLHHHHIRFQVGGGREYGLRFDALLFYREYLHGRTVAEIHEEIPGGREESLARKNVVILCHFGFEERNQIIRVVGGASKRYWNGELDLVGTAITANMSRGVVADENPCFGLAPRQPA